MTRLQELKIQVGYLLEMIEEIEVAGEMPDLCDQAEHVRNLLKEFLTEECNRRVDKGGVSMNKLLVVKGMGWEAALAVKVDKNSVIARKRDLETLLKKISYTHDVISGGFTFGFED